MDEPEHKVSVPSVLKLHQALDSPRVVKGLQ